MNDTTTEVPPLSGNRTFPVNPFRRINDTPLGYRIATGFIGVLAIFANAVLITVLLRLRGMLAKPYNILILNLAVIDALTGVLIFITPNMVIPSEHFSSLIYKDGYCHLISSHYFVMAFAKASILTVTCLAFNRWLSLTHPIKYKLSFTNKRACIYIVAIWIVILTVNAGRPRIFAMTTDDETKCFHKRPHPWPLSVIITTGIIYTVVTFFLPMTICWMMFVHIYYKVSKSVNNWGATKRAKMGLLRMCVLTALAMTICWAPSEVYLLVALSVRNRRVLAPEVRHRLHNIMKVIGLFNSCMNPFIYCLSNRTYREKFVGLFSSICPSQEEEEDKEEDKIGSFELQIS